MLHRQHRWTTASPRRCMLGRRGANASPAPDARVGCSGGFHLQGARIRRMHPRRAHAGRKRSPTHRRAGVGGRGGLSQEGTVQGKLTEEPCGNGNRGGEPGWPEERLPRTGSTAGRGRRGSVAAAGCYWKRVGTPLAPPDRGSVCSGLSWRPGGRRGDWPSSRREPTAAWTRLLSLEMGRLEGRPEPPAAQLCILRR